MLLVMRVVGHERSLLFFDDVRQSNIHTITEAQRVLVLDSCYLPNGNVSARQAGSCARGELKDLAERVRHDGGTRPTLDCFGSQEDKPAVVPGFDFVMLPDERQARNFRG